MKKIISLFSALLIMFVCPMTALSAEYRPQQTEQTVEYFEDGSYMITKLETEQFSPFATSTTRKTKSADYYSNSGKLLWVVSLTGNFSYTGSSATCTSSSASYKIYDDAWKVTASKADKNGRQAIGNFTVKKYTLGIPLSTVNKTITISCSNTGVCS